MKYHNYLHYHSRFKIYPKLFLVAVLLGIFIWQIVIFSKDVFTIKTIDIQGDKPGCLNHKDILELLTSQKRNWIQLSSLELEKILKEKFVCLDEIKVQKIFPDKLKVEAKTRQPKIILAISQIPQLNLNVPVELDQKVLSATSEAQLREATASAKLPQDIDSFPKFASPSALVLIDDEGVVFQKVSVSSPQLNLPIIQTNFLATESDHFPPEFVSKILKIFSILDSLLTMKSRVGLTDQGDLWIEGNWGEKNDKIVLLFNLYSDIDRKLASLQLIKEKLKMNSNHIRRIDLRFKRPIIVS